MASIVFQEVWKAFGDKIAVKDLSFKCQDGEFFVLLGHSGAGKTTIINLIAGLERPTAGSIYIDDKLVNRVHPRLRDVAVAFENYALYPHIKVYDNIAFPLRAPLRKGQFSAEQIDEKVRTAARLLQIDEFLDRAPSQLSGGQRQRVALARTLIRQPAVYLLDEAIAHLDAKLRHLLRGSLKQFCKEEGGTVIFATPDQLEAVAMGDRIAVINEGELQQIAEPMTLYLHPANECVATAIGEPPMNVLEVERTLEKDRVWLHVNKSIRLEVDAGLSAVLRDSPRKKVRLGIRPVDISVSAEKSAEDEFPAKVVLVEALGQGSVLTAKVDGIVIKIKLEELSTLGPEETIWLKPSGERLYVFDAENGNTIWPKPSIV